MEALVTGIGLTRQVEGKIYYDKFDSLSGWTEEEDLRNSPWGNWGPWGDNSYSELVSSPAFSPSTALDARIEPTNNDSGDLPSGRYLRRTRDITIPAGVTSVRMQVQHRWYRTLSTMAIARKITLGAEIFLNQQATDSQSTWFFKNETVATAAGAQTLKVGAESYATVHPLDNNVQHHYFDDLVVARSGLILVQQLAEDWTARLYDAADVLIAEAEEDGGTATLDVEDEAYPITGRIKLYNASDELEYAGELRTDHYGGDEWIQFSIETMLTVSVDNYIINKTGEAAPTTATITFTLKDGAGDPIVGNTITFTTSHGDLDPESDETDVNGQVSTELTADTMGLAIVKAVWAGDETYPRSFETVEVSVHDAEDDPDELAEYDVWIQGKKISGCGPIVISSSPGEHLAEFEIPEIDSDVKGLYDFAIYRYGTCVFFGRIETLSMIISPMPIMKVQGRSMIRTLMRTQIDSLVVTDTLKNIIDQVYDDFLEPRKQVLLGTLSDSLDVVSVTVNGEDLIAFDVISRMAALGGATLSVDASRQMNVM